MYIFKKLINNTKVLDFSLSPSLSIAVIIISILVTKYKLIQLHYLVMGDKKVRPPIFEEEPLQTVSKGNVNIQSYDKDLANSFFIQLF